MLWRVDEMPESFFSAFRVEILSDSVCDYAKLMRFSTLEIMTSSHSLGAIFSPLSHSKNEKRVRMPRVGKFAIQNSLVGSVARWKRKWMKIIWWRCYFFFDALCLCFHLIIHSKQPLFAELVKNHLTILALARKMKADNLKKPLRFIIVMLHNFNYLWSPTLSVQW